MATAQKAIDETGATCGKQLLSNMKKSCGKERKIVKLVKETEKSGPRNGLPSKKGYKLNPKQHIQQMAREQAKKRKSIDAVKKVTQDIADANEKEGSANVESYVRTANKGLSPGSQIQARRVRK